MRAFLSPLRIAAVYAVFGALWILLSDSILHSMVDDPDLEARLQTYKGWTYVAVTALLVYLLTRQFARTKRAQMAESAQMRAELRGSELRILRHIENTPLGCVSWDRNFVCTEWNKAAEEIFGFTAEEAIGRRPNGLILPDAVSDDIMHVFELLLQQQGGARNVNENRTKDGGVILCEWYNTPIVDADGEVVGVSSLVLDVTEQRRAEAMLLKATEDAQAANMAKSQFLATMSHEFRTPLNAILGFSEMMMPEYSGIMTSDKYASYANDIHRSGRHMLSLVNDMLDVSEIEAGERRFKKEAVDVAAILRTCVHNLGPAAAKAGVSIALEVAGDLSRFHADSRSVHQIVLNLLSNAVKFTPHGGRVEVAARLDGGDAVISVSDTGIGIPADKLQYICEPFSRLVDDPHKTQVGTGLGLAIVKSLVEMHDGALQFDSEVGVGTTVTIRLPIGSPA